MPRIAHPRPARNGRDRLAGVLLLFALISSVFTVTGFAGGAGWAFDLTSHFRVQYAVGLGAIAVLLALLRRRALAAGCAAFAVINGIAIAPIFLGSPAPAELHAPPLRVMLINVNTANTRYERVRAAVREAAPDVLVLLEINGTWAREMEALRDDLPHALAHPRPDNFGLAVYARHPLRDARVARLGDKTIPSIIATVGTDADPVTLIATHPVPPKGGRLSRRRNRQLAGLARAAREAGKARDARGAGAADTPDTPVVVLGDLNVTPWSPHFRRLLADGALHDSARGRGPASTWPAALGPLGIPIDHCLHSRDVTVTARRTGPPVGSDHLPLIVDLRIAGRRSGATPAEIDLDSSRDNG